MIKATFAVLATLGLAASAGAVNLVTNPGFENAVGVDEVKAAGSTDIVGWTVARDGVFLASGASWDAAGPNNSVELSGTGNGNISQSVSMISGKRYELSFDYSVDPSATEFFGPVTGLVSIDGNLFSFSVAYDPDRTADNMLWATYTAEFVAVRGFPTSLTFLQATGTQLSGAGVVIDNVFLSLVPEPATWGLLIAGFGMVGFSIRRRRGALTSVTN